MKKTLSFFIVLWCFIIGGAFLWNYSENKSSNTRLAYGTARAFFHQIVIARTWNARIGGVYAPVSEKNRPNKYLKDVLRDVETRGGIKLTKINPAYMTRQLSEIAQENKYGAQLHITSLKPVNPNNKPFSWEIEWLNLFKNGAKEAGEFVQVGEKSYFRYMAPLYFEESCFKCHSGQGYKKGDIRGGISILLPNFSSKISKAMLAGYGLVALIGWVFIIIGIYLINRKKELLKIESAKRMKADDKVKKLSGIIPICMHCKQIRDDNGYWNRLEKFISEHSEAEFSHGICDKCLEKYYK